jgi:hypothetical protein
MTAAGIVAPITLVFEHPLHPAQRLVIERVRALMQLHKFELHDIEPQGESIRYIPVANYVRNIDLAYDEATPNTLTVRFTVQSKQDRDVLVWTSSLFFQYVHYHVARIATMNGAAHHMDWEAQQDPQSPERVKRWVEHGQSLIERLHKGER